MSESLECRQNLSKLTTQRVYHILVYLRKLWTFVTLAHRFSFKFFLVHFCFCAAHQPNEHLEEAEKLWQYYVLCIPATAFIGYVIMIVTTNNFSTPQLCLNPHFVFFACYLENYHVPVYFICRCHGNGEYLLFCFEASAFCKFKHLSWVLHNSCLQNIQTWLASEC